MKTGIEIIAAERERQIKEEGWTAEYDAQHGLEELSRAAAYYALPESTRAFKSVYRQIWPWDYVWYKPTPGNRIRELAKAGALIAAEIDRIQNQ